MSAIFEDFQTVLLMLRCLQKNPKTPTTVKMEISERVSLYMDTQQLHQYYPELHWRIDAEDFMATKKDSFNLIEYRLTDAELEGFDAWIAREKITMVQALNYCAEKLIKTSFTYSEKNNNWCVSLTGQADNRFNSGATLTNWSDDPLDAFFMGIYKASVVFQDGAWKTRKSSQRG